MMRNLVIRIAVLITSTMYSLIGMPHAEARSLTTTCEDFSSVNLALIMQYQAIPDWKTAKPGTLYGDFSDEIKACQHAIHDDPSNTTLLLQYARTLIAQLDFDGAVPVLRELRDRRNPVGARLLGYMTIAGLGMKIPDGYIEKTELLYEEAIASGDKVAPLVLGRLLFALNKPGSEYGPYILQSARAGYAPAEVFAAGLIDKKLITGATLEEAIHFTEDAARQGWPPGLMRLAAYLRKGDRLPRDVARAEALERQAREATHGMDPDATHFMDEFG